MKLSELKTQLSRSPAAEIVISLPDGTQVPRHFHVTEVGRVRKDFVDCGGTFRSSEAAVLQTWTGVAQDDGHRLTAGKLVHILGLTHSILPSFEIPVEVEHEAGRISQFPVESVEAAGGVLTIQLGSKHTDCLARAKCQAEGECGCGDASETEAACCAAPAAEGRCC